MEYSDVQNTIIDLKKSGVGVDGLGYRLYLYHQINCKIIHHKIPESGSNSGKYYVEGDVTSFISGYSNFWIVGRKYSDDNIFSVDSATYHSDKFWTEVVVTEDVNYKADIIDVGSYISGQYDATNIVKDVGDVISDMYEEGSLGNSSSDKFQFILDDGNRSFYDRKNRSGYLFPKSVVTEIDSVQGECNYSPLSGISSTFIGVEDLSKYGGSDFLFGEVEFITGNAAGNKYTIIGASGNKLKLLGHLSKSYLNTYKYFTKVKVGDRVKVTKTNVFWSVLECWSRSNISEKLTVFCGKIDPSYVKPNDVDRTIQVSAFDPIKDLFNLDWSSLNFNGGMNLQRLSELKVINMDSVSDKLHFISRSLKDNLLSSVTVQEVAFDVSDGWHILDYCPFGLFRFDLGKWYQVIDEGSFEKSTNSVFITSCLDSEISGKAELPSHSSDPGDNENIERSWHGGWCKIKIETEEDLFINSVNKVGLNDGNQRFKKLSGLPDKPVKMFFFINKDRSIEHSSIFTYSFDNGELVTAPGFFDYIKQLDISDSEEGSRDVTYPLGFGRDYDVNYADSDVMDNYPYPWRYDVDSAEHVMQLYSFNKFNGILLKFRNEYSLDPIDGRKHASNYDTLLTRYLQYLTVHFSDGSGNFKKNISLVYAGGYSIEAGTQSSASINLKRYVSRDGAYGSKETDMVGMKIVSINGDNFLEVREINSVSDTGDTNATVDLVFESFSNAVAIEDRFIILNKDFDIKFMSYGNNFQDGPNPDVIAIQRVQHNGDEYFLDVNYEVGSDSNLIHDFTDLATINNNIRTSDKVYIGHRSKFNTVVLALSNLIIGNDDVNDVAWFLKNGNFIVEYYDGFNWKVARDVSILPSTHVGLNDVSTLPSVDKDDLLKLFINFKADDWSTGGYDNNDWSTVLGFMRAAPSDIDSGEIYMIRLVYKGECDIGLDGYGIGCEDEVNLAICWDNIPGWSKNVVEISNGKYLVDNLQNVDLALDLYGIELQCKESYTWLRQARPITKMVGANGDKIYSVLDHNNIDMRFNDDVLAKSDDNKGWKTIPRNINYYSLLNNILSNSSYKEGVPNSLSLDTSSSSKDYLNPIGTCYDGFCQVDIGWDEVFVNENVSDYFNVGEDTTQYRHVSSIRDNGKYRLYAVKEDKSGVDLWVSDDMKTLNKVGEVINVIGSYEIWSIECVKNKDHRYYTFYVTAKISDRYRIYVYVTTNPESIDMSSATEIISDDSHNFGTCSVVHAKGNSFSTINCMRMMCAVRYSDAALDGNGDPSGTPYLVFFDNSGTITNLSDWGPTTPFVIYSYHSALDPVFVKNVYSLNYGSAADNEHLNTCTIIYRNPSNDYLYRIRWPLYAFIDGWTVDSSHFNSYPYEYPEVIKSSASSVIGYSCLNDGYIYNKFFLGSRDAHTLSPTFRDGYLIVGVNNNSISSIAMNMSVDDWSEDLFWISKKQECNGIDWFKTFSNEMVISDSSNTDGKHKRVYLGLRRPFNKIFSNFKATNYSDRILVRYWNGNSWSNFDNIYQNGMEINNSKVSPLFGFYWDEPNNWRADSFNNIVDDFTYSGLERYGESLFWVEVSLPSGYSSDKEMIVRSFKNCYVNLFAYKGRSLYMMNNWDYFRNIYSFPIEGDKNVNIDSVIFDKMSKLIFVNLTIEDSYGVYISETFTFDSFGNIYKPFRVHTDNSESINEYQFISRPPKKLSRSGYENDITIGGIDYKAFSIGGWDEDFLLEVFGASSFSGYPFCGYNIPISREQYIRKHFNKNSDWELDGTEFSDDFINNVWVAKRSSKDSVPTHVTGDRYQFTNSYNHLLASLSSSGLFNEELINKPYLKVLAGFYAFVEKSYKTKLEWIVQDVQSIVSTYPTSYSNGEVWLVQKPTTVGWQLPLTDFLKDNHNKLLHRVSDDWQISTPYIGMVIKDLSDSNQLYIWNGNKWEVISNQVIWPGRVSVSVNSKIWLEFDSGNEGVDIRYFRDYDQRPNRFLNNNTDHYMDKKLLRVFKDIDVNILENRPFGTRLNSYIIDNIRATCSVLLHDLSSVKDSFGDSTITEDDGYGSDTVRVLEPASPAIAFGVYAFRDMLLDDSVVRDDTNQANPYAYSGVALYKCNGRVRNWKSVLQDVDGSYTDYTNECNYKSLDQTYVLNSSSSERMLLCSDSRFFAIAMNCVNGVEENIGLEYLDKSGSWQSFPDGFGKEGQVYMSGEEDDDDVWGRKTKCITLVFDPFQGDWQRGTINGTEGYWVRITTDQASDEVINWAVLSGTMLWDNIVWWNDYTVKSYLSARGNDGYDTWIPISIEYDHYNKALFGCFWNFDSDDNRYYPFRIKFDKSKLYSSDGEYYWNWEHNNIIDFVDSNDLDLSYKIQSIALFSPNEAKTLLVDDGNKDVPAKIATLKSFGSGDKLFSFPIA